MPEFFDISFIVDKTNNQFTRIEEVFREKVKLLQGENIFSNNMFSILNDKNIIYSKYQEEKSDFIEYIIGISNQVFHKDLFKNEISEIIKFVDTCFSYDNNILLALGSYELNEYLLNGVKDWQSIINNILIKFPIVFINKKINYDSTDIVELDFSRLIINHQAQDIF